VRQPNGGVDARELRTVRAADSRKMKSSDPRKMDAVTSASPNGRTRHTPMAAVIPPMPVAIHIRPPLPTVIIPQLRRGAHRRPEELISALVEGSCEPRANTPHPAIQLTDHDQAHVRELGRLRDVLRNRWRTVRLSAFSGIGRNRQPLTQPAVREPVLLVFWEECGVGDRKRERGTRRKERGGRRRTSSKQSPR